MNRDDDTDALAAAVAAVPPGRWAVGVSGGADSVALLTLLHERRDFTLHVAHLDHETRARASAEDAEFVCELAGRLTLPCTVARRSDVERGLDRLPANASSRFRAARLALFRTVVHSHGLCGVILAHHANDQAETILLRLLRGSGPAGLAGMSPRATVGGLVILRPLLGVRREALRKLLESRGQVWREDASNASADYRRNRVRHMMSTRDTLADALLELGERCRSARDWLRAHAPEAGPELRGRDLLALPVPIRRELARRWLVAAGVPDARVEPAVIDRLIAAVEDAATPARQHFPGGVVVRRSRGVLTVVVAGSG